MGVNITNKSSKTTKATGKLAIKAAKNYMHKANLYSSIMGKPTSMNSTSAAGSGVGRAQTLSLDEIKDNNTLLNYM